MRGRIARLALKVVWIVIILALMAVLLQDSSHQLSDELRYDAAAPVEVKCAALARWIPFETEVLAVVDPPRLFSIPGVGAKVVEFLKKAAGWWGTDMGGLVPVFAKEPTVGLIAAAVRLGLPTESASIVLVVQGKMDVAKFASRVEGHLARYESQLERGRVGDVDVYTEVSQGSAFSFAFPDRTHLVLGQKDEVERIIKGAPRRDAKRGCDAWPAPPPEAVLFGWLNITPRLEALLPDSLKGLEGARFSSDAHFNMVVTIPASTVQRINDLVLFIEGLRISYLITGKAEPSLARFLHDVRIEQRDKEVVVRLPLAALF